MTKKEFYNLIDEFVKAGYNEKAEIRLYWVAKPDNDLHPRYGGKYCSIFIRWYKEGFNYRADGNGKWNPTAMDTGIEILDTGTWFESDPRRFVVTSTGNEVNGHPEWNCDYKTPKELLDYDDEDGYSAIYGNSYRKWEIDNR